ncbi:MAG: carbohydate-binding domain-containing protein [Gemmatimonadota bacterium]|nr:carbohydate-binding domain-containing protein [Gemmatimonadota bacterium]MDH3367509.1 carbohydate-binding domain-containing protein [Gemmatimonadota bacterium]MDH3477765.1 carbohydate-binding domain-containing protein [Gemmatimonadota bacterium]MDH5548511.1 carbohydate-binding domain-containing protein [Gemmatimonadota bacterium]
MQTLDVQVVWKLETNFAEGGGHRAQFTIRNDSDVELTAANWELYWNMSPRTVDAESITGPVRIEWINGDFYRMKPTDDFRLPPGRAMEIAYRGDYAVIKETDAPAGLYSVLYADDGSYRLYPVREYSIAPFVGPEQMDRGPGDTEPIPTAAWLFDQHAIITELPDEQVPRLIPTPRSSVLGDGHFEITHSTSVTYEPGLLSEAELLADFLGGILGRSVTPTESRSPSGAGIHLQNRDVDLPGSYELTVSGSDGVVISGDASGVFYGSQSLKALIPAESLGRTNESIPVRVVRIQDAPAFAYRGMHLDVGRNFHSATSVKRLIDAMAFYKLNKLHLNLTEDEGWRVEIEELPELTQVGAFRGHTTDDAEILQPSYGSGPFPDSTIGYGSGFYSRAQYVDLIRFAGQRHIEIIPEVNVPGHARAAVKAMENRYRRLMARGGEADAEQYRLIDPDDASEYRSAQWYTDNVISVCRESAYTFLETVIDDFIEMHEEAGFPLRVFHTGGDEVPTGAWSRSPLCATYLEEHPEIDNPRNLQKVYFKRIEAYLASKGVQAAGWEEIAMNFREDGSWTPNDEFAAGNVIPYIWNSLWGAEDLGNRLANAGYPVVLCNVTNFYFDLAYNKDPREPGLYWGGFVNTRDAFEFVPYDVFKSIKTTPDGKPYTNADFAGKEMLTVEGRSNILGLQGQLWSETLKGQDMLEYYYLPKMLGLAERAWYGQAEWGNIADREERGHAVDSAWDVFANTLGKRELPRLDRLNGGYNYRLAPPGAKVQDGRLVVNTAYPGLVVRYTTDGSVPTAASPRYTEPLDATFETVMLSTFDPRGRSSLPTVVTSQAR